MGYDNYLWPMINAKKRADDLSQENEKLRRENTELKAEIEKLKKKVSELESNR